MFGPNTKLGFLFGSTCCTRSLRIIPIAFIRGGAGGAACPLPWFAIVINYRHELFDGAWRFTLEGWWRLPIRQRAESTYEESCTLPL